MFINMQTERALSFLCLIRLRQLNGNCRFNETDNYQSTHLARATTCSLEVGSGIILSFTSSMYFSSCGSTGAMKGFNKAIPELMCFYLKVFICLNLLN